MTLPWKLLARIATPLLGSLAVACEYGVPMTTYAFDGDVVAAEDGAPIQGIKVSIHGQETHSADDGTWALDYTTSTWCPDGCEIFASDTDGSQNGSWRPTSQQVVPQQIQEGQDAFDNGIYQASDIHFELEPDGDTGD